MPFDVRESLINVILILLVALIALGIYYLINIGNTKVSLRNRLKLDPNLIKKVTISVVIILIALYIFTKHKIIGNTLVTIIISLVIAYLINPLVKKIEGKGIKRAYAILLVYLVVILVLSLIITLLVPKLSEQIMNFIYSLPRFFRNITNSIYDFVNENFTDNVKLNEITKEAQKALNSNIKVIQESLLDGIGNIGERVTSIAGLIVRLVLIPVFSFYFIMDKERYIAKVKKFIPEKNRDKTIDLLKEIDTVNSQFVRGRLLMALAVGVLTAIFLFIMRVDFALVVGIITCVADIIPYIGPALGFIPAVLIAFLDSPIKALIVALVFVLIQWVENNVLAPKILGTTIGLNPLVILLCLILGAGMFGVPGMIFSVPVVATIKVIVKYYKEDLLGLFADNNEDENNIK